MQRPKPLVVKPLQDNRQTKPKMVVIMYNGKRNIDGTKEFQDEHFISNIIINLDGIDSSSVYSETMDPIMER